MHPRSATLLVALLAVASGACGGDGDDLARGSTSAPARPATTTAPASTSTSAPVVTADAQPATPGCPAVPAQRGPDPRRPRYDLGFDVRPEEGTVTGDLQVRFQPDLPTDRLVFRLWPNGPRPASGGAHLDTGAVTVAGRTVATDQPDPTTLTVTLDPPLAAGEVIEARLPWVLTLPGPIDDRVARAGGAVRLGSFFPILAWEPTRGWAIDPPTSVFAEASSVPVADFTYRVTVPDGYDVLATGVQHGDRWDAPAVRDIALSIGQFRTARAEVPGPRPVTVTVGVHEGVGEDPAPYLERVVRSLEEFAGRYGPYPYSTLSLAITPDLRGGIEYPGHIMQGPGTIGRTTPHEVAHQWFYALVGNNQGRDPWLDEGLATWAEARFEGTLDSVNARSVPSAGRNRTGEPMVYWEQHQSAYYRAVYTQGAQALAAVAAPDVVDCGLRHYVAANAFDIAGPEDLAAALELVAPGAGEVLARYGAVG